MAALAALCGLLHSPAGHPQESLSRIDSEGEATIEAAPARARFVVTKNFPASTLDAAADRALAFGPSVEQALRDLDLAPIRRSTVAMALEPQPPVAAEAEVTLWFAVADSGRSGERIRAFTETVERLRKLSVSLGCAVRLAGYEVDNPESVEQEAVARATENAIYHADAIGELVGARVTGVERVSVLEVAWSGRERADTESLRAPPQLRCFARVRVFYTYASAGGRQ